MDNNLFKDETRVYFENISIYIFQYPNGNKAFVSYGKLNEIKNDEIIHIYSTEYGSSGSPILNLSNNKAIGMHKQGSQYFNFNIGTSLKSPLNKIYS